MQLDAWQSWQLEITPDEIIKNQVRTKEVRLRKEDIKEIDFSKADIQIKAKDRSKNMVIPAAVAHREEVLGKLEQFFSPKNT